MPTNAVSGLLLRRLSRVLLFATALAGVAVTIMPALSGDTWWIRYLDFPRLQFLLAMLAAALLLLLFFPGKAWTEWALLAALSAACAYDASVLVRYAPPIGAVQVPAACPADARLRVLEANVQMSNRPDDRLLRMVQEADPDLAWFQEIDRWWEQKLVPLEQSMPFKAAQPQSNYYGVLLLSKLRLDGQRVLDLTGTHNPAVFTGAVMPSGQEISLYAIHPRPPQVGQSTAERDGQIMAAALAARDDTASHIILGDLNAVPWETVTRLLHRVARVLDPREGRGLHTTWKAGNPVLRWPLDHILAGPEFQVLSLHVLPGFRSDHQPYLAELCLDPAGASGRAAPKLRPGDLAAAQAAVQKGRARSAGMER